MADAESRSLRRAECPLLLVSALRGGTAGRAPSGSEGRQSRSETDAVGLLDGLTASTENAALDRERRSVPLADGERLDPNSADAADLDRLPGVGPSTARAIVAARDSGVVFRNIQDLLVVRGIGPALLSRVGPFVEMRAVPLNSRRPLPRRVSQSRVDLNRADSRSLQSLPGIGPALAARILLARAERPFSSLEELSRVPGIGPSTVRRLRGLVSVGSMP